MDIKNILERIKIRESEKQLCICFDTEEPQRLLLELAKVFGDNVSLAKISLGDQSIEKMDAVYSLNQIAIALLIHRTEQSARTGIEQLVYSQSAEELRSYFCDHLDSVRRLKRSLEREELALEQLLDEYTLAQGDSTGKVVGSTQEALS